MRSFPRTQAHARTRPPLALHMITYPTHTCYTQVLFAFAGVLVVTLASPTTDSSGGDAAKYYAGNLCLFLNCLTGSSYVMLSRSVLKRYPPICVCSWSYVVAAVSMTAITLTTATSPDAMYFLCPACQGIWVIPRAAIFSLCHTETMLLHKRKCYRNERSRPSDYH